MPVTIDGTSGVNTPSLTTSGSTVPVNGMYLPTTNAVGLATNSVERLRIDSAGNVGIGTSSPTQKLDVAGQVTISSGNGYLWGNGAVQIYSNSSYLRFRTASTDRLEIDSSGNLGLGVTPSAWRSATRAMQIGSTSSFQNYDNGATIAVSMGNNFYWNSSDQGIYIQSKAASNYYQSGGQHVWQTAASGTAGNAITFTQAMTLDASGRLGIGATSPAYSLEVVVGTSGQQSIANFRTADSTAANNAGVQIFATPSATATSRSAVVCWDADGANASGTDYFVIQKIGNSGNVDLLQYSNAAMTFATNATERARITSGGDLLVGTTSSGFNGQGLPLVVGSGSGNTGMTIFSGSTGYGTIQFAKTATTGSDSYRGVISYKQGDDFMYFSTAATERMRIDASGRVGINTTTNTTYRLAVNSGTAGIAGLYAEGRFIGSGPYYSHYIDGPGGAANANTTTYATQYATLIINNNNAQSTNNEIANNCLILLGSGGAAINPADLMKGYSYGGNSFAFRMAFNGNLTNLNNSYGAISDERLKQDITDAGSAWDDLKGVRVRKFRFKDSVDLHQQNPHLGAAPTLLGVVAQELEQVSPGLVEQAKLDDGNPDPDSMKQVKYSVLYMKAIKALQEAMSRIEQLEQDVAQLKGST